MAQALVGIIGGSGVYHLPGLENVREVVVPTPFGEPSDALRFGRIGGTEAVFLARHRRGHRLSPDGINYRANIYAMKKAGVTDLVSVSACGSFREELSPGTFVVADQIVDRTVGRASSFFGNGCVAHVSMAHPVAPRLAARCLASARAEDIEAREGGTYVCMQGPQFSSLAESLGYKAAGYDVIGMTAATEAKLAREAELSYALVAMVTDYDCWHPDHAVVDVASVIAVVQANAGRAERMLMRLLNDFPAEHEPCPIGSDRALDAAIVTPPMARDPGTMEQLGLLLKRVDAMSRGNDAT